MPYVPVNVFVLTGSSKSPVQGVVVRLLDGAGRLIHAQAISDTAGKAAFLLPAEQGPYESRFYKQGLGCASPVLLDVDEAGSNDFSAYVDVLAPPLSTNPRLCVAFGVFRDAMLSPNPGLEIHFMPLFDPLLVDGDAVLKERTIARAGDDGYMQISLIRFAQYEVTIVGMENYTRTISVPDQANVNLPDLLFPVVGRVIFAPAPDPGFALTVGESLEVTPEVWTSSGVQLYGTAKCDVRWSSSDESVLGITPNPDKLILRGMSAGTASLIGVRYDNSVVRIPSTPITGVPVAVTVS